MSFPVKNQGACRAPGALQYCPAFNNGMTAVETPDLIHDFWFGSDANDLSVAKRQSGLWWSKKPEHDREIRERFEPCTEAAGRGELEDWAKAPRSLLALILLTDQFPRCLFRGSGKAFAFDGVAQRHCLAALEKGMDRRLRPIEKVFLYLPLQHAESEELQERAVLLYSRLFQEVPADHADQFRGYLTFALRHRRIIARFGRFPHRNAALGRASTAEEIEFLKEPGSSF